MIAKTHTCSLLGIDAVIVEVEVGPATPVLRRSGCPKIEIRNFRWFLNSSGNIFANVYLV